MSYINQQSTGIVRVKLTEKGREKLAKGQLSFNYWAIGDSEVDYDYIKGWNQFVSTSYGVGEFPYHSPGSTYDDITDNYGKVLRPKDQQPNLKSFIKDNDSNTLHNLNSGDLTLLKATISNAADERGFFSGTSETGLNTLTGTTYIKKTDFVDIGKFDGSNTIILDNALTAPTEVTEGDFVMFIMTTNTLGQLTQNEIKEPTPNLWYKIGQVSGSTALVVDRSLPTLSAYTGIDIQFMIFPGGHDPINDYYGSATTTSYWNTGTLSFDSSCDISVQDVPVWNMNNVWSEDLAGIISPYHGHELFGSTDYIGSKEYLGYNSNTTNTGTTAETSACDTPGNSQIDSFQKGIGLLHYSNNTISNFYGEFFHIDEATNKLLSVELPIMWDRRSFSGTSTGTITGMKFVSDTEEKTVTNSGIKYYDLVEYSGMTIEPTNVKTVGRVYPQLKIVTIHDEELLGAMSYKSNRNWTLPELTASLSTSSTGSGVLESDKTIYLTYDLEPTSGFTASLPCQKYIKLTNNLGSSRNVQFNLNGVDRLPYMRKVEDSGYDGRGFFAHNFNLLVQIVDDSTDRPDPALWKKIDFTNTTLTTLSGQTINPIQLENQSPLSNSFVLTPSNYSGATTYNLGTVLELPQTTDYDSLQFGDSRAFYGNLSTYIGATIYKTLFNITVDGKVFQDTTNPTFGTGDNIFISEVGIYDSNRDLVMVGKLNRPVRILNNSIANIEVTIDF